MYIERTERYCVGASGTQGVKRARFLILLQRNDGGGGAANTFAVVRKVAMRQIGHWMMGSANLYGKGKWASVSGSYGSDGLPMSVDTLPKDAKPLPPDLYEAWNKGGGWNGAGSEAQAMAKWANEAFPKGV